MTCSDNKNNSVSAVAVSAKAPALVDLNVDNITPNTVAINNQTSDPRLKYVMARLVSHLHDLARETRLSSKEWMACLDFLIACGQTCSDVRNEFILLSDVLGLSLLVDSINHPKPARGTEGTVLGPFHTDDAEVMASGGSMSTDPKGEPLLVVCAVLDLRDKPVAGVKVDIWETDSTGRYDTQYPDRDHPSERCVMQTDEEGGFWFRCIKPVSYPIPHNGPVGKLLAKLNRHCWRPAHVHFMFEKQGWDHLITALYLRGDPYETSDAVFGVKKSLIVDLDKVNEATAQIYGVDEGIWLLRHEFVLLTEHESKELKDKLAVEALKGLGLEKMKLVNHLPVPDVD